MYQKQHNKGAARSYQEFIRTEVSNEEEDGASKYLWEYKSRILRIEDKLVLDFSTRRHDQVTDKGSSMYIYYSEIYEL